MSSRFPFATPGVLELSLRPTASNVTQHSLCVVRRTFQRYLLPPFSVFQSSPQMQNPQVYSLTITSLMSTFWGTLKNPKLALNRYSSPGGTLLSLNNSSLKYFQWYFHNIIFHLRSVLYRQGFVTCLPVFLLACLERVEKKNKN